MSQEYSCIDLGAEQFPLQKNFNKQQNFSEIVKISKTALKKRTSLPEKPNPIHLNGQYVRLEPLIIKRDAQPLFEMSNGSAIQLGERSIQSYDSDELIWRYMFDGPFKNIGELIASLQLQINASNGCCLCVFDIDTGKQIGVTNLMNNFPSHLKIELGGIWYSPIVQRTLVNTEATYLMLKYCFELGYRRVEWKCHSLNERSRRAALRMGFKFEGIQESHMIVKDCNRDTAWFRILDREWSEIQKNLELRLYSNSSPQSQLAHEKITNKMKNPAEVDGTPKPEKGKQTSRKVTSLIGTGFQFLPFTQL